MEQEKTVTHNRLTTPRAAAVAGIVFSVLFIVSLALIRRAVPADPQDAGTWLSGDRTTVSLALNLLPFAGIAFLWFIGVLRDRLGALEDRFFATVFLGSGLLFLAMLFAAGAVAAGVMIGYRVDPDRLVGSGIYTFARAVVYQIVNIYALKMAGVFMISTSTVALRTRIFPRWMAFLGFALALLLLLSTGYLFWTPLVFPLWVLLISAYILLANLKRDTVPVT
jgi:MFS family permease